MTEDTKIDATVTEAPKKKPMKLMPWIALFYAALVLMDSMGLESSALDARKVGCTILVILPCITFGAPTGYFFPILMGAACFSPGQSKLARTVASLGIVCALAAIAIAWRV